MSDKARNRVAGRLRGTMGSVTGGRVSRYSGWVGALRRGWPWVVGLLGIALLAVVWIWGPAWQIGGARPLAPWPNRLLVILCAVLVVLVIIGLRLRARLRDAEPPRDEAEIPDPVAQATAGQEQGLNHCLDQLRRQRGRHALQALPWYLVLGPEGSGKTSLVQRSGQRFSLTRSLHPQGGEASDSGLRCWASDRAVTLEPGAAWLLQGGWDRDGADALSASLWQHLVGWLQRRRPRRPLDGVLLVLDLSRLTSAGARDDWGDALRERLQELTTTYQSRLPVYVVFSQMDRLYGFDAFFRHAVGDARCEPWGFSFSAGSLADPDAWEEEFTGAYRRMLGRIERQLVAWLAACRDQGEREALFRFSRQLAGLEPLLSETLQRVLGSRRYAVEPLVRGVYFASLGQQGVPIDAFADAATARYRLPDLVHRARRNGQQSLAWFSERLLQRVVFPEAGLAGDSLRFVRRRRWLRGAGLVFSLAGLSGLVIGWGHYYQHNLVALQAVEARAEALADLRPAQEHLDDPSGQHLVPALDELREVAGVFDGPRGAWAGLADMGLYQGHRVGDAMDQAYLDALRYRFLPALMLGIADEMNTLAPGSEEQLVRLRVLRMLADARGREPDRVRDYMADRWQALLPNRGRLQGRLLEHLDHALVHTDLAGRQAHDPRAAAALAPVAGSIRKAQQAFSRSPVDERVYTLLKRRGQDRAGGGVRLDRSVGSGWGTVFRADDDDPDGVTVSPLLTRDGFEQVFLGELDGATVLALNDLWVLGERDDPQFSERDEQRLREALREQYVADFHAGWRRALGNIHLTDLESIPHAVIVIDALLGGGRPLERLLAEIERHTRLYPELPVDDDVARDRLRGSSRYRLAGKLAAPFQPLHALHRKGEEADGDLAAVRAALGALRDHLRAVEQSSEPGRIAYRHARNRLLQDSGDPVDRVERLAEELPAPLDGFMAGIAEQSWRLISGEAIRYLEQQWLDEVIAPFEADLAGRYPLEPNARREVALEDFERFFAAGGTLDSFFMDKLQPFLDEAPELLEGPDGRSLLNPRLRTALERAERIREAYFGRDGLLDVGFTLAPVSLSGDKRRSVLNVDGQILEYRHGAPQRVAMLWPNSLRQTNESGITLVPDRVNRSPRSERHQGAWAWFRLLDEARVVAVGERELRLSFQVDGGEMSYRLTADRTRNPFTRPLTRGYTVPATLYRNGVGGR
ncbi:type VI secretion system membrane subunit TssM [Alkalilimnicola ehrlichii MLHE-1]|uniref:ImcF domain protein n=1 Tax=Alkalilimnicola ehrlichii (strain ATCC BAA-1101 / DSM 17681 / MLHE-1) TaxID=187272 RepID=Q0ACM3_ALKEH|nr:type VI secretion system membrane subunit TssM [Alkalilimnicola ehrlichii]ABI55414.1 ImcF domain protein [Alkalilimnicola ehrlichii MLHE-1]